MRHALLLALLLPAAARAADPPIVFQTQPIDRLLGEGRTVTGVVGGEKAVKEFNDSLKQSFGEKGLAGLDLSRPVLGYSVIAPKFEQSATVFVLPITTEKDFLDLVERANKQKPKPLPGGLFELPKSEFADKAMMRIVDAHAYICLANDPAPHLDPKAIVPANTLFDPAELALACGKLYPDRLPKEVREKFDADIAVVKKDIAAGPGGGIGWSETVILKAFGSGIVKLQEQALAIATSAEVKELAVRLNVDAATADLTAELRVTAKPGTLLEKLIAAKPPATNRFAGLLTADTVGGFKARLPLFNDDLRAATAKGLEEVKKMATENAPPNGRPFVEELFNGLVRVAKTGEMDIAVGVRGPDKAGALTFVAALPFEDGAALDKAVRKFIDAEAPPDVKEKLKWDAAKVGDVPIHELKVDGGFVLPTKAFGGDKAALAFAFGPKGLYATFGPDAVATMKDVLAAKPAASPVLDVVVNPARVVKAVGTSGDPQAALTAEEVLGKEDKLKSALSLAVDGGKDLRVTLKMNATVLPRALMSAGRSANATFQQIEPGIKK